MKKIISIMLSLCLAVTTLAAALPSSAAAKTQVTPNLINTGDVAMATAATMSLFTTRAQALTAICPRVT